MEHARTVSAWRLHLPAAVIADAGCTGDGPDCPRRAPIETAADTRIDYVELRDAEELAPLALVERPAVLALAVFVGAIRLIDNRVLG